MGKQAWKHVHEGLGRVRERRAEGGIISDSLSFGSPKQDKVKVPMAVIQVIVEFPWEHFSAHRPNIYKNALKNAVLTMLRSYRKPPYLPVLLGMCHSMLC